MKKLLTVVCLLALVIVCGVTAWWFFIASFGDRQMHDFIAKSEMDGVTITIAETERSGFPMRVQWQLRGVSVAQQSAEGALDGDGQTCLLGPQCAGARSAGPGDRLG